MENEAGDSMIEPPACASLRFQELVRFVPTEELVEIIGRVFDNDRTRGDLVRGEELARGLGVAVRVGRQCDTSVLISGIVNRPEPSFVVGARTCALQRHADLPTCLHLEGTVIERIAAAVGEDRISYASARLQGRRTNLGTH